MSITFIGQTGVTIQVEMGIDITGASTKKIKYRKPSGETGEWTATVVSDTAGVLKYTTTTAAELDEAGLWDVWPYAILGDGSIAIGLVSMFPVYAEGAE